MQNWDQLSQNYPNATQIWDRYALLALKIQHVQIRRMDVNESTKALTCAGLFLEAVGNDQQEIVQLTMQFTIRAENGGAGALFGTVRNNVQLNETSVDGVFLGGQTSGTLFGRVARGSKDPIRVDMTNSHYCIIGKVKDTCLPDPAYKESEDDFSAGEND